MPVTVESRRGTRSGQTPYNGFTNLYSEVTKQGKEHSQDVRLCENWANKRRKTTMTHTIRNQDSKNDFFYKQNEPTVDREAPPEIKEKQQGQLVTKPAETRKEKKKNIHPDQTESSL